MHLNSVTKGSQNDEGELRKLKKKKKKKKKKRRKKEEEEETKHKAISNYFKSSTIVLVTV
jgi:hypothetical protein